MSIRYKILVYAASVNENAARLNQLADGSAKMVGAFKV